MSPGNGDFSFMNDCSTSSSYPSKNKIEALCESLSDSDLKARLVKWVQDSESNCGDGSSSKAIAWLISHDRIDLLEHLYNTVWTRPFYSSLHVRWLKDTRQAPKCYAFIRAKCEAVLLHNMACLKEDRIDDIL